MFKKLKIWLTHYVPIVISIVSMLLSLTAVWYAKLSDERAEALFGTQVTPIVQERPIIAHFDASTNMVTINFELTNITNFVAKNIGIDAKFGDNVWVSQWSQAKKDDISKKKTLTVQDKWLIEGWKTEKSLREKLIKTVLQPAQSDTQWVAGSIDISKLCGPPGEISEVISTVKTRATWTNERKRFFDRISSYELVCTRVDSGISMTFMLTEENISPSIP